MRPLKRIYLPLIALLLFSCKKETPEGGLRFVFRPQHSYTYNTLGASVSYTIFGDAISSASTSNKDEAIKLLPLKEGKYVWHYSISYNTSDGINGSRRFDGEVIVEKGTLNEIIIED